MRLLYVVRLFSGLEPGLRDGVWQPRGVPTIYRMIDALDRSGHDVRLVFTSKDFDSYWTGAVRTLSVRGLRNRVTVVAESNWTRQIPGRARGYLRETLQAWPLRQIRRRFRPDVMYFDRVNIYQAALAAWFTTTPVVWRVMGVPPSMHRMLDARDPVARFTRHAYRAPFAHVICSRDGSGGEAWMARALAPTTPRVMMINGADPAPGVPLAPEIAARLPADRTKVLFVARLVEDKGCLAFMQGFLGALAQEPGGLHAVVAGDGPFAGAMRAAVEARGALDRVSFLGQVPHDQIAALHRSCDIYVSLNPMGNLTNANLEALCAGACMIIPASQPERGIDTDTDEIVPSDIVVRVRDAEDVGGLTEAIIRLHRNPAERAARAGAARDVAKRLIPSWEDRIVREIALLEDIAQRRSINVGAAQIVH